MRAFVSCDNLIARLEPQARPVFRKGKRMATRARHRWWICLATSMIASGCGTPNHPIVLPFGFLGNFPVVTVQIDGHDVPLVFDSGNSGSIALTQAVIDRV